MKEIIFIIIAMLSAAGPAGASLSDALGATKLDGLDKFTSCQNEAIGFREGLIADRLELKLANTPNLTPEERQVWLSDIAILRRVQQTRQPDRTNAQHYLLGLTGPEQQAINSLSIRNTQEIHLKCEQLHGGMLRYSPTSDQSGQTRYENSLREQMAQPLNLAAIPVEPLPTKAAEKTPDQILQEKKAAQDAMKQAASQKANECLAKTQGLRPKIIAQMLQAKLDNSPDLSPAEKAAFQQDIQAAWAAAGQGLTQIQSSDPVNPYRVEQRLSPQEQIEANNQYGQQMTQMMVSCASQR